MKMKEEKHCSNCGAPVTTEVCPYCHVATGLDTEKADMEYPIIECKEAHLGFWNVIFPMIFAFSFGSFGIGFPIAFLLDGNSFHFALILAVGIFGMIGIVAFVLTITPIVRYLILKFKGKEIDATVYGYMDDNIFLNERPAQIVKLFIQTKEGPRFILYQLNDTKRPYRINSKIKLRVYQDKFLILKNKKYYFE